MSDMVSSRKRSDVWEKCGGICHLCERPIENFCQMTIDHFIPKSQGGTNELSNLFAAHHTCNWGRGSRDVKKHKIWLFNWLARIEKGPPQNQ